MIMGARPNPEKWLPAAFVADRIDAIGIAGF